MRTGGIVRRGEPPVPLSERPAWVQLALQMANSGVDTDEYRDMINDIREQRGHPYRDRRYRNLHRRDRQLYNRLRQEQIVRDQVSNEILSQYLPPELIRQIQGYRHADENREMNRITNRR